MSLNDKICTAIGIFGLILVFLGFGLAFFHESIGYWGIGLGFASMILGYFNYEES